MVAGSSNIVLVWRLLWSAWGCQFLILYDVFDLMFENSVTSPEPLKSEPDASRSTDPLVPALLFH